MYKMLMARLQICLIDRVNHGMIKFFEITYFQLRHQCLFRIEAHLLMNALSWQSVSSLTKLETLSVFNLFGNAFVLLTSMAR